jgi:multiple sugar transport system ATP-binding protein
MGNEVVVHLLTGDNEFLARVDPRTSFRVGNKVDVVLTMDNAHIFDQETEQAIR